VVDRVIGKRKHGQRRRLDDGRFGVVAGERVDDLIGSHNGTTRKRTPASTVRWSR
jgi:hypothetical protein